MNLLQDSRTKLSKTHRIQKNILNADRELITMKTCFSAESNVTITNVYEIDVVRFEIYTENMARFGMLREIIVQLSRNIQLVFIPTKAFVMDNIFLSISGERKLDSTTYDDSKSDGINFDIYGLDRNNERIDLFLEQNDTLAYDIRIRHYYDNNATAKLYH